MLNFFYKEAYEQLTSVQPQFYSQAFEEAALTFANMLGFGINGLTLLDCFIVQMSNCSD
jgi:hypothetical protein